MFIRAIGDELDRVIEVRDGILHLLLGVCVELLDFLELDKEKVKCQCLVGYCV